MRTPLAKRTRLLLLIASAAGVLVLPAALASRYRNVQQACFDALNARHAPLEDYERLFGPHTFRSPLPSGGVSYGYPLTSSISAAVVVTRDGVEASGKDVPDSLTFWDGMRSRYADAWSALRHGGRFVAARCE